MWCNIFMSEPDFDKFLADATSEAEAQRSAEARGLEMERRAEELLDELHPDRAFSFDDDTQSILRAALINAVRHKLILEDPDEPEEYLNHAAELAVDDQILAERTLVFTAMITAAANEEYLRINPSGTSKVDATKKKYMAELLVVHDMRPDDTFLDFVDAMIPGEKLDTTSPADAHFLSDALEEYTRNQASRQIAHEFVTEALGILRITDIDDAVAESFIVKLLGERLAHPVTRADASQLDASYDEIIRSYDIPPAIAQEIIALITKHYPL